MAEIENTATIRVVADASGVEAGLRPAVDAARRAGQAVSQVGDGAGAAARNVEAAQRNIIASIQRTTVAMESGGRQTAQYYQLLAQQRGVDPGVLTPYLERLRQVEQAQTRVVTSANAGSAAMGHVGLSAAQINQELRFLPNRFQNIADSITAGQRPMTIFIQQGGELVTSFGGIGTAARAVGGYVLGLVSPLAVGAVAVGAIGYAFKTGADEAAQFQRSLILSGNAAGATSSQLAGMAHSVAAITGSLDGSKALSQLVESTKVPAENLQKYSVLAVEAQQVLGKSIEDTVGEFTKLGQAPLQTLTSLSAKYDLITFATLKQVKALQDQGKATEAANIAQETYARAVQDQKDKVLATLSSWEKAWMGLKMYAADAANWVVDMAGGRETSNFEKINKLLSERARLTLDLETAKKRADTRGSDPARDADVLAAQAELDANLRNIDAIRNKNKAEQDGAAAKAKSVQQEQARKDLLSDSDILLSKHQIMQRDLAAAEQRANDNNLTAEEKKQALDIVRKKYFDVYLQDLDVSIGKLEQQLAMEELIAQRKKDQIQANRDLGLITEQDAISQQAQVDLKILDQRIAEKRAELSKIANLPDSGQRQQALTNTIGQLQQQRLTREQQQKNELLKLDQKRLDASRDLFQAGVLQATAERDSLLAQVKAQNEYGEEIGLSAVQVAELRAARLENTATLKDETAAALEAIEPGSEVAAMYRDQAMALRELGTSGISNANKEQMISQWKQAISQYDQVFQQGFADMLNNGRAGWSSFTKSLVTTFKTTVADEIYKLFARPFVVQLVGSFLGVSSTAIAGEIASQPNAYGVSGVGGDASSAIGAAQAASTIYKAITGGFASLSTGVADAVQAGLDKTGLSGMFEGGGSYDLTTGLPANGAFASAAGTAASYGAGVLGGHYVGNAIAGDYSINHGQAVTNIASVIGAVVGGPIGGAIGGALGGLINRAFGHGSTEVQSQGLQGTLTASALTGNSYQNLHQDGGWFTSDRNWKDAKAFTDQMVAQFTQGLAAIETTSSSFAKSLGVSADWVSTYSKDFNLALTGDATKDQQAITDFFNGIGDEIAKKLVPNLDSFSKSGETAAATLERLAGEVSGTDQIAQLLGKSSSQLFGSTGLDSIKAREGLIDAAGGLSILNQQAAAFNRDFLTDAERLAPVQKALTDALASLGYASLQTRDDFKDAVNGLITSGAAVTKDGAQRLASLLALEDAFAQVHPAADAAADAITAAANAFQQMKDTASTLYGDVDSAFTALQSVVGREKAAVQTSIDAHTAAVSKLQDLSQALHSTLESLRTPEQLAYARVAAQAEIRADLAITKAGGSLSDAQITSLKKALGAVSQDASSQFGSREAYLRDLYQTQNNIAQLGDVTDDQLSVEQQALKAAQDQLSSLDQILTNAQAQIDVLKGQSTTLLSIDQAIQALGAAISSANSNPLVSGTTAINQAYQSALGRTPDAAGLEYWQKAIAGGASTSDVVSAITNSQEGQIQSMYQMLLGRSADADGLNFWLKSGASSADIAKGISGSAEYADHMRKLGIPGFASGGMFGGGLRLVGEDGPELEATGPSRIWSSNQTAALLARVASPSDNSAVLTNTVKSLQGTIIKQQEVMEEMAKDMASMADTLKTVAPGGFVRVKGI